MSAQEPIDLSTILGKIDLKDVSSIDKISRDGNHKIILGFDNNPRNKVLSFSDKETQDKVFVAIRNAAT